MASRGGAKVMLKLQKLTFLLIEQLAEQQDLSLTIPINEQLDEDFDGTLQQAQEEAGDSDEEGGRGGGKEGGVSVKTRRLFDAESSNGFAQMMAVAALVTELVSRGKTMALRDVYYTLKHMFRKQIECNNIILDLGLVLGLKRHEMGIVPNAKGLVAGLIRFRFHTEKTKRANRGERGDEMDVEDEEKEEEEEEEEEDEEETPWVDCMQAARDGNGARITSQWHSCAERLEVQATGLGDEASADDTPPPRFLLVVEKAGIFKRLCEDDFYIKVPCIMITGCGNPDIATKACVHAVMKHLPHLQTIGLADYNSYGLALLLTYRFGSMASRFEGEGLRVDLKWLGLRGKHVHALQQEGGVDKSSFQQASTIDDKKISAMLKSEAILHDLPEEYEQELEQMKKGKKKCELEVLFGLGIDYLSEWLEERIDEEDWI